MRFCRPYFPFDSSPQFNVKAHSDQRAFLIHIVILIFILIQRELADIGEGYVIFETLQPLGFSRGSYRNIDPDQSSHISPEHSRQSIL